MTILLCLVLLIAAVAPAKGQTIYYWKDAKGEYHFYTTPKPPDGFVLRPQKQDSNNAGTSRKTSSGAYSGTSRTDKTAKAARSQKKQQIDRIAEVFGRRHRVDPKLVRAVIQVESSYNHKSVSRAGAQGLMQIMPATGKDLGLQNPFDPIENVEAGVRYLRMMLDRFKDVRLALAAYNAGPAAVEKYGTIPPYAETRDYVTKVLAHYRTNRMKAR
ncbi:hypothetical protein DSM19430T_01450 [Desulfovibrio psychrotolerans]|uniref:Lytic transglycosylase n=1 Tax=Desulfovibrio psychrotolerans TaxID=415242 RepID=A0A7J0BQJ2_9BACT|nr:hypothetical protein DSM19430T_01450 [Desulfovibrio psychrotolerans]